MHVKSPLVSVIIPAYNRERFIKDAIKSVILQTYQEWELIVVDDGSTDRTKEMVAEFVEKHPKKIHYLYQAHQNAAVARNAGIKAAKGEYLAFLDSDDMWYPTKLEIQMEYLDRTGVGFVHCLRDTVYPDDRRPAVVLPRLPAHNSREFLSGKSFISMTGVVKKELVDQIGMFDEKLVTTQDTDLWLRLAQICELGFIDKPLMQFRHHKESISSSNKVQKLRDRINIYQKMLKSKHREVKKDEWKRKLNESMYNLALELYGQKAKEFKKWLMKALVADSLIGRSQIKSEDTFQEKIYKLSLPYRLLIKNVSS